MTELRAYGKINLTLEVLGVREDGFHLLRSVMQSISQFDRLVVENSPEGVHLTCSDCTVPTDGRNTVVRAAELFFAKTRIAGGVRIELHKGLPHQAGLGAASADAAAMLRYLWEEYDHPISFDELLLLGEEVGSDVPFCLIGGTQLAEGKGEQLQPLTPLPPCTIIVVKPRVGASTPAIFRRYDSMATPPQNPDSMKMVKALEKGSLSEIASLLGNALMPCVGVPEVAEAISFLGEMGALGVSMTGSGSAVFGIFAADFDGREIYRQAEESGYIFFVCKPIN